MRVSHASIVLALQLGFGSFCFATQAEKPPMEQGREILEKSEANINWPRRFVRDGMLYAVHAYVLTEIVQKEFDLTQDEKARVQQLAAAYIEAVTEPVSLGQARVIQPMEAFRLKDRRLELERQLMLAEGRPQLQNQIRAELGKILSGRVFGKFDVPSTLAMAIGSALREELLPRFSEVSLRWELLYPVLPSDGVFQRLTRAINHPDVPLTLEERTSAGKTLSTEIFNLGRFRRRQTEVVEAEFPRIYAACVASMTPDQRAALLQVMMKLDKYAARLEWIATGPGLEPVNLNDQKQPQKKSGKRKKEKPRLHRRPR